MRSTVLLLSMGLCFACGYSKQYVPTVATPARLHSPTQQRLMAVAVGQAVSRSAQQARLNQYAGRTGQVEVNGVFPPSDFDLLAYIATQVEAEMHLSGMVVMPRLIVPEGSVVMLPARAADEKRPDVRVVASLDWSGIDYTMIKANRPPPQLRTMQLDSRVRLTMRTFPAAPGLLASTGVGDGAAQVIIDPDSREGFTSKLESVE